MAHSDRKTTRRATEQFSAVDDAAVTLAEKQSNDARRAEKTAPSGCAGRTDGRDFVNVMQAGVTGWSHRSPVPGVRPCR